MAEFKYIPRDLIFEIVDPETFSLKEVWDGCDVFNACEDKLYWERVVKLGYPKIYKELEAPQLLHQIIGIIIGIDLYFLIHPEIIFSLENNTDDLEKDVEYKLAQLTTGYYLLRKNPKDETYTLYNQEEFLVLLDDILSQTGVHIHREDTRKSVIANLFDLLNYEGDRLHRRFNLIFKRIQEGYP